MKIALIPADSEFAIVACVAAALSLAACSSSSPPAALDGFGLGDAGPHDAAADDGPQPEADAGELDAGHDAAWSYGLDCKEAAASTLPATSPHVLILGPSSPNAQAIAAHLQGMFDADPALQSPLVEGITIETGTDGGTELTQGGSLMYFYYAPEGREARLAKLSSPWSHVVLLEQSSFAVAYPEFYFEGVRVLGCAARAVGAKPVVLMTWSTGAEDIDRRGEVTYRVANGTNSVVAPAGYSWQAVRGDESLPAGSDELVAAASLYGKITGRSAATTGYAPQGIPASKAAALATQAFDTLGEHAGIVHYQSPYVGVVQSSVLKPVGALWFMDWGTSSEALWHGQMTTILTNAGFKPQGTTLTATNQTKTCDSACLEAATPFLGQQQYRLFYARDYSVDAETLRAVGAQSGLQVQVWDRHADGIPSDGLQAVGMMEYVLTAKYDEAKSLGLALTPYHLMFARLKTLRPSIQLTSDGTHATGPVSYGQATLSVVSRTGIHVSTSGLDPDTSLAAQLAEETIRQLSSLSALGEFVPDKEN